MPALRRLSYASLEDEKRPRIHYGCKELKSGAREEKIMMTVFDYVERPARGPAATPSPSIGIDACRSAIFSFVPKIGAIFVIASLLSLAPAHAQQVKVLKISHQFPASQGDEGDFRDRLCRKFAQEVEKRTNGQIRFEIHPSSSLVKATSQFSALRKGALDMSLVPLAYGGGEVPAVNITLMPTTVSSYEEGMRWKDARIGRELDKIVEEKGVKLLIPTFIESDRCLPSFA